MAARHRVTHRCKGMAGKRFACMGLVPEEQQRKHAQSACSGLLIWFADPSKGKLRNSSSKVFGLLASEWKRRRSTRPGVERSIDGVTSELAIPQVTDPYPTTTTHDAHKLTRQTAVCFERHPTKNHVDLTLSSGLSKETKIPLPEHYHDGRADRCDAPAILELLKQVRLISPGMHWRCLEHRPCCCCVTPALLRSLHIGEDLRDEATIKLRAQLRRALPNLNLFVVYERQLLCETHVDNLTHKQNTTCNQVYLEQCLRSMQSLALPGALERVDTPNARTPEIWTTLPKLLCIAGLRVKHARRSESDEDMAHEAAVRANLRHAPIAPDEQHVARGNDRRPAPLWE